MERLTITVHEMSKQLGISLPKAYELTRTKGFPLLRIGSRVLIPLAEFRAWIC